MGKPQSGHGHTSHRMLFAVLFPQAVALLVQEACPEAKDAVPALACQLRAELRDRAGLDHIDRMGVLRTPELTVDRRGEEAYVEADLVGPDAFGSRVILCIRRSPQEGWQATFTQLPVAELQFRYGPGSARALRLPGVPFAVKREPSAWPHFLLALELESPPSLEDLGRWTAHIERWRRDLDALEGGVIHDFEFTPSPTGATLRVDFGSAPEYALDGLLQHLASIGSSIHRVTIGPA